MENEQFKDLVYRGYCPICFRFLFKYTVSSNFAIFFRCGNCKNTSSFILKNKILSTATLNREFKVEPEGAISEEEKESIFKGGKIQKL
jgi:hypothetical protein